MKNNKEIKDFKTGNVSKNQESRKAREERLKAIRERGTVINTSERKKSKRNKVLLTTALVLAAIIGLVYVLWLFGIPQRNLSAMKINDEPVTITEYNYNYYTYYNQYNQVIGQGQGVLNKRDSSQIVSGQDISWGTFFHQLTVNGLMQDNVTYQKAIDAGYTLDEEDNTNIDLMVDGLRQRIGTPLDFEMYLESMYGKGMTVKEYRRIVAKQYLARQYSLDMPETYEIAAEDVEEYYANNTDSYDLVDYRSFTLKTEQRDENDEPLSAEALEKKVEETKALAEKLVAEISSAEDMEPLAEEHDPIQQVVVGGEVVDNTPNNEDKDQSLQENTMRAMVTNQELGNWLFAEDRKADDVDYIKVGNDFIIVYFLDRKQDTRKVADVIVSSFDIADSNGFPKTEEEIDSIRKTATSLASTFKTEEDVKEYDETEAVTGVPKATEGNKLELITAAAAQHIDPVIVNFALSEDAEKGTAHVVESERKIYVITILERHEKESWYEQVENVLQSEAYEEDFNKSIAIENNEVVRVHPGFELAG